MQYPVLLPLVCAVALFSGCATTAPTQPAPAPKVAELKPLDEARLNEARMLKEERRFLEAAAIYEEQSKLQPQNAELVARQAHMFSSQARVETVPANAKAMNKRARALAEQAEKLGTNDPLTPLILASVQPDGSTAEMPKGEFSKHEQADKLIRDGEEAFNRRDFANARECYQKAFELEPTNYTAALWTGDAYFSGKQTEPAAEWYRKAIVIDPENETAHRYLGDALAKLGRREEALTEYIAALLCQPYQRLTRQHFAAELRAVAEAKGHVIPRFPAMQSTIEKEEIKIVIGPDTGALFLAYNLGAMRWRKELFSAHFPNEKGLRRSLPEELDAINVMLTVAEEAKAKNPAPKELDLEKWQPILNSLAVLKRDGLLEAYVLFERADEGLAKDFAAYRAAHRDKLEHYIRVYWCGFE